MKLLMISTDRNLFAERSSVADRMLKIKSAYDELHIIVFSLNKTNFSQKKLSDGIFLYPTNSFVRIFYILNSLTLGFKVIKNNNFSSADFITCQDPFEVGLAGFILKKFFKLKLELQIHTDLYSPYFKKHSILNRIRVVIANVILSSADSIRVVSKRISDSLVERGIPESKIAIRPIEVNLEELKNTPALFNLRSKFPQFDKVILIISRLEAEKNIAGAIKAFALTTGEKSRFGLVIVGSGRELANLKNLVSKLKIEPQVAFEGWQAEVISYYRGCDTILVTSWYEGYGLIYKEAQALGCKIVSTDVGIAKEIGATIVGWKPEEIARGLNTALNQN